MRHMYLAFALLLMLLTACGRAVTELPAEEVPMSESAQGEEWDPGIASERTETTQMEFFDGEKTKLLSASLQTGEGYSLYVPEQNWRLDKEVEDGVFQESWEHTVNDEIRLSISRYDEMTPARARAVFAAHNEYRFGISEDSRWENLRVGMNEEGDVMEFASVEGENVSYIISWEYPGTAKESFGALLRQMASTFAIAA